MSVSGGGAPESREPQEIRIELRGSFSPDADLEALQEWLRRESWYQEMDQAERPTLIRRRPEPVPGSGGSQETGGSEQGPSMGVGLDDIILLLASGLVQEVYDEAFQALKRWYRNRRRLAAENEDIRIRVTADGRDDVLEGSDEAPHDPEE